MHNTDPVIPAPGTRDVTDPWIPPGNPELRGPRVHPHHPSAPGQDKPVTVLAGFDSTALILVPSLWK